ncbi:hypothetical protein [Burkholderia gladioli]|uniref:hypothetical protein n=1 Tax=Burkholderia gladioli TaxID=28095 RepID=UPI003D21612F
MKKENLRAVLAATALCLGTMSAHASVSCEIAGQYDGKYEGKDDHGFVRVTLAQDGTLVGKAQSLRDGAMFAVGGVVASDGKLSTDGAVDSGARFSGRFFGDLAGGTWTKTVMFDGTLRMIGGSWGVQKTASIDGCQ